MNVYSAYKEKAVPQLKEMFQYRNVMSVPKVLKVTVNVGVGRMSKDKKHIDEVVGTITRITGQKPVIAKARKSISAFKVKQGDPVGVVATLRGKKMWDFLDKLVNVTFPRVRDFRGINPKLVDGNGNLSIGFKEQIAFPEIMFDQAEVFHGLEVNITTNAKNSRAGLALFTALGFPFQAASSKEDNSKE